jgi:hypothetical protein
MFWHTRHEGEALMSDDRDSGSDDRLVFRLQVPLQIQAPIQIR